MNQKTPNDLITQVLNNKYSEFDNSTKEILKQKTAEALDRIDYFKRLDQAQGITETKETKETYKEFMAKKLKKYQIDSPADLDKSEKKKFFDEIDAEWEGENEND